MKLLGTEIVSNSRVQRMGTTGLTASLSLECTYIVILKADAVDKGTYRCTAVTKGKRFNASSEAILVHVVGE